MKKSLNYFIFMCSFFLIFVCFASASTIKETLVDNDDYDTIERNTTIIGITKFLPDEVITASKSAAAGSNDAMFYFDRNGTSDGYILPKIFIYYGPVGGWYMLDEDNNVSYIEDEKTLNELSEINIYYVNNSEKIISIEYVNDVDVSRLPAGVKYNNGILYVNATLSNFTIYGSNGIRSDYYYDENKDSYVVNKGVCFVVEDNSIIDYDSSCGSEVVIPSSINNIEINAISPNAFNNKNITKVTIPKEITSIGDNAFDNNELIQVIIKDKYDVDDFDEYGNNVFGSFDNIKYDNILTNILDLIPSNYQINVSKDFDVSNFLDYSSVGYVMSKMINNDLKREGYNFVNYTKDYDNFGESNFELRVISEQINEENIYTLKLSNVTDKKTYTIEKTIYPYYNYVNNINDKKIVEKAVSEIKETEDIGEYSEIRFLTAYDRTTNFRILNDIEEKYSIDFIYELRVGSSLPSDDELIETAFAGKIIYVAKDNVIYSFIDKIAIFEPWLIYKDFLITKYFSPPIKYEDYDDVDSYINEGIRLFEERTGEKDYTIMTNSDGTIYTINDYSYSVVLLNSDGIKFWTINYKK